MKSDAELRAKIVAELQRHAIERGGHSVRDIEYPTWWFPSKIGVNSADARRELKLMEKEGLALCHREQSNKHRWRLADAELAKGTI